MSTAPKWDAVTVRKTFVDYFTKENGHTFFPSSKVVPYEDPTLLFVNSGMVQVSNVPLWCNFGFLARYPRVWVACMTRDDVLIYLVTFFYFLSTTVQASLPRNCRRKHRFRQAQARCKLTKVYSSWRKAQW